ncbi:MULTISPECIES: TetR/AcrR family transcriptional regulator [unclassified Mesorhizobium]|uniref:TetR/AcrR family transcriptional regulator n=1 Tax=unclassified Mesorhizobium TaxID=325217 RepID=UPI000FCC84E3|nr:MULTISPECIES: TetR/AcrR family transcriptional regulator [unclassified Mesorhizobium]RUX95007.1 TetR/AcrR family transcriptional regulator [Mesorhizobium sp. M7D.F.Ca.US.004.01.2.1]RVA22695.1 TetR/AcrR family transcriptional regulator [Mesorhizobium sp. M7D.F.Ca.US.004.03.1.1]
MTSSPGSDKRQHVVETAYTLFKRAGFHATGIDRIIAEAEVAKMTMYRHFPSKDELIVEVLDYRARRFESQLDRLAQEGITPEQKIGKILDWHERWFRSPDFHGCLFAHALAEFGDPRHPVFKAAARQKNGLKRRMQSILEEVMPRDRAESVATVLLMLIEGATLVAQMGQADTAIRDARKAALGIVAASRRPQ